MADDEGRTTTELVRAGANLPSEDWNESRIAAARQMLPQGFRDTASMISFLARAHRSGLDPFSGELHAWKNERGELQFQTSRDGFVKILRRDPKVEAVEVGAVFENDEFSYTKEGGVITVHQAGVIDRGRLIGAYCLIKAKENEADHIEIRLLEDFKHLLGKTNWKNYPIDMLQARCVSAAARLFTTSAAGIYTEADWELTEDGRRTSQMVQAAAEEQTDELAQRLAQEESEGSYSEPIEVEAEEGPSSESMPDWETVPEDENLDTGDDMVDGRPNAPETPPPSEEEKEAMDAMDADTLEDAAEETSRGLESTASYQCRICTAPFDSHQALAGHMSGHRKRDETLPEGWEIVEGEEEDGEGRFYLIDADGVIQGPDGFESWQDAAASTWVEEEGEPEEGTLEALKAEYADKSRGQILVAVYRALEPYGEDMANEILQREKRRVAGTSEDDEEISLNDLTREQRLELLYALTQREDDS